VDHAYLKVLKRNLFYFRENRCDFGAVHIPLHTNHRRDFPKCIEKICAGEIASVDNQIDRTIEAVNCNRNGSAVSPMSIGKDEDGHLKSVDLTSFLLMTILTESFFPFVGSHLMALAFLTAGQIGLF